MERMICIELARYKKVIIDKKKKPTSNRNVTKIFKKYCLKI